MLLDKDTLRFKPESPYKNIPPELWLVMASYLFNPLSEAKKFKTFACLQT